ncbi:MAG: toxin-antitoxin system YwqK family antitoxin [Verrucomicrobia bacterium]|nr:toxin-antitoxin system YwqK family antitoxin [Verrucomicrobiota bacterium]
MSRPPGTVLVGSLLGGLCAAVIPGCAPPPVAAPPEVPRSSLVLQDGRLHRPAQAAPFTGTVVEYYAPGRLQSRSVVSNGLLHGLSEGWHTNGVRQVAENFVRGASDGVRVKWYPGGAKLSEAAIAGGKLNGTFRRWHENGRLAEQIELRDDQPHGESMAYYPSGCLKTRVRMERGLSVGTELFKDGEVPGPPVLPAAAN